MSMNERNLMRRNRGVGLIEVMISVIIAMLLVLVIYQVYEISEGQKRTITGGSDAQQNASYGMYALGHDLAMAGNGIAPSASAMLGCFFDPDNAATNPYVLPIPVVIKTGAMDNDPDTITVFYGGSSSLSTPAAFQVAAATTGDPYTVRAPVGFSPNDVIVAVQGTACAVSTINAAADSVVVNPANGDTRIQHTPIDAVAVVNYGAISASLINLGQPTSMGRVTYSVNTTTHTLQTERLIPTWVTPNPVISEIVNLKAQYGLDTDGDGVIDAWENSNGVKDAWESSNGLWLEDLLALPQIPPTQRLNQLRRLLAVRVAIVTRSAQYEKEPVTAGPLPMLDNTVSMTLNADDQHYRYKVLETVVPLRNALWNTQ